MSCGWQSRPMGIECSLSLRSVGHRPERSSRQTRRRTHSIDGNLPACQLGSQKPVVCLPQRRLGQRIRLPTPRQVCDARLPTQRYHSSAFRVGQTEQQSAPAAPRERFQKPAAARSAVGRHLSSCPPRGMPAHAQSTMAYRGRPPRHSSRFCSHPGTLEISLHFRHVGRRFLQPVMVNHRHHRVFLRQRVEQGSANSSRGSREYHNFVPVESAGAGGRDAKVDRG